jgi:hypothetical protein
MGTNYYVLTEVCKACSRSDEQIHIGKSSVGWEFSFAWNDGEYYKNIDEFKIWLSDKEIVNEYDEPVTQDEFWSMVQAKKGGLYLEKYYKKYPDHNKFGLNPSDHEITVDGVRFVKGEFS